MPFGKHKGKDLEDVPADYLLYIYDNNMCSEPIREYIEDNLDVLKHELKQKGK